MESMEVIQIVVILLIVVVKFGVIIGTVLYVKHRNERKKQEFLDMEARRRMTQTVPVKEEE